MDMLQLPTQDVTLTQGTAGAGRASCGPLSGASQRHESHSIATLWGRRAGQDSSGTHKATIPMPQALSLADRGHGVLENEVAWGSERPQAREDCASSVHTASWEGPQVFLTVLSCLPQGRTGARAEQVLWMRVNLSQGGQAARVQGQVSGSLSFPTMTLQEGVEPG